MWIINQKDRIASNSRQQPTMRKVASVTEAALPGFPSAATTSGHQPQELTSRHSRSYYSGIVT